MMADSYPPHPRCRGRSGGYPDRSIRLTPVTPDAAQPAQTQPVPAGPQALPAHTGCARGSGQLRSSCHRPHRLYAKPGPGLPPEPTATSSNGWHRRAINTGAISGETTRCDEMAARLTSIWRRRKQGESTAHTGLLDKFRLGGFHLGGKADDSRRFRCPASDTAEIPVSRRRDFESAEDAPRRTQGAGRTCA